MMKTLKLQVLDLVSADDTLRSQEFLRPPTSESENMFQVDSYYDLDNDENDDEDEAEELPYSMIILSYR